MTLLAAIVLLAASGGREVVNEVYEIPAGDWKYPHEITIDRPARISVHYEVERGSGRVRAALMRREDREELDGDLSGSILVTPEGRSGYFVDPVRRRGDYVVVLDNQDGREAATVHLRVELDYATGGQDVIRLTPERQVRVVALSCLGFLGIVWFSARRLLKSMQGPHT